MWDLYRVFLEISRAGSISKAAEALGMSEPTVSRRLDQLESDLGVPLFWRGATGLSPTKEALSILNRIEDVDSALSEVRHTYKDRVGSRKGVIRISAPPGLISQWLSQKLALYFTEFGVCDLEVESSSRQIDLAQRQTDIVFRVGDPGDTNLVGTNVAKLVFGCFARRELPESLGIDCVSFEELGRLPMISPNISNVESVSDQIEGPELSFFPQAKFFNAVLTTDSWSMMKMAVESGTHAAFLPIAYCGDLQADRLPLNAQPIAIYADLWILRRPETRISFRAMELFSYLKDSAIRDRDWFESG